MIHILATVKIQNSVTETMAISLQGIWKKQKLRKHFYKGSNFREWQSLNYSRCKKEIEWTIKRFAGSLKLEHEQKNTALDLWVNIFKKKSKIRQSCWNIKNKFIILPLYCKIKKFGNISKIFKQYIVLSPLIKHQTTFLSFVRNSMFLSFSMKQDWVVQEVILTNL